MTSEALRRAIILWNAGLTGREVAERLGLREKAVASALREARLCGEVVEERHGRGGAGRLRGAVWSMHLHGMAPSEIDAELGMDQAREIVAALWSMGWPGGDGDQWPE